MKGARRCRGADTDPCVCCRAINTADAAEHKTVILRRKCSVTDGCCICKICGPEISVRSDGRVLASRLISESRVAAYEGIFTACRVEEARITADKRVGLAGRVETACPKADKRVVAA